MKEYKRKLNTISRRFTLIISVAVIGCMLAVQLSAFFVLRASVEEHGQATMVVANESICMQLEDDYYSMLQISQMMASSGIVGQEFYRYLRADTYSNMRDTFTAMEELLTTVTFSSGGKVAIYYDLKTGENYLQGYQSIRKDFQPDQLPVLLDTGELTYHAVHASQNRYSSVPVVSLMRHTSFWGYDDIVIYVEKQTNLDALLKEYQDSHQRSFIFLQTDADGRVCYSTSEQIPLDTLLTDVITREDAFGQWEDYFWSRRSGSFGGYSLLLTPKNEFHRDLYAQLGNFLLAVILGVLLIFVAVLLLNELIIKKHKVLLQEIQRVGEGNLSKVAQRTGLYDYDFLLDRFDWMIEQVHLQMRAVEEAQRRNGDIEREILYYQINPHFLLNSLNSAYWQAKMNIKGGIDQYIAQLTGILRYSLGKDTESPTLQKEVEILRLYLQLQEKRYDFTYTLEVEDGSYLQLKTPKLFIQPVVENSIEHGMDVGGHIKIRVFRDGNRACVYVQDNGVGMSPVILKRIEENMDNHNSRAGIGLRYVKTVITAMFGDAAQIKIDSCENVGTRVYLTLPLPDELADMGTADESLPEGVNRDD